MDAQLPLIFDGLPPGLQGPEREIAAAILGCRGRKNAVSKEDLMKRTGLGERRVRLVVRKLVDEHQLSILTSVREPVGYYVPAEPGEIRDYCRTQMRHAVSCIARVRQVTRNSRLEELMGQLELEMDRSVGAAPLPNRHDGSGTQVIGRPGQASNLGPPRDVSRGAEGPAPTNEADHPC